MAATQLSKGAKWTIGILLFILVVGGGTWIAVAASKRKKRKQTCMDQGLEGADLDACINDLKTSEKANKSSIKNGSPEFDYGGTADDPIIDYKPNVNNGAEQFNEMMTGGGGTGISTGTSVFPLKYGSRGKEVKTIQKAHNFQFPTDKITVDGVWGNATEKRAKALLAKVGITGTPVVTKTTYNKWFKRFE